MSYIGEDSFFSYRDGKCEFVKGCSSLSAAASCLGRKLAVVSKRFTAGCCDYRSVHVLYAICSGIAEAGADVYVCESTDIPSLLFSQPLLAADCALYVNGGDCGNSVSLFNNYSFPFSDTALQKLLDTVPGKHTGKSGRMIPMTSFSSILANNISDSVGGLKDKLPAGISCGNRFVRSLWQEFFSGEDDKLVFQVSDDGLRVNAYSQQHGFLSCEKLKACYAMKLLGKGEKVWLPEDMHYEADIHFVNEKTKRLSYDDIPENVPLQRFLTDPLFMCVKLFSDADGTGSVLRSMPELASSRREITVTNICHIPFGSLYSENSGRISVDRSGRNRIRLTVQSYSTEAAAELCSVWTEKLRRLDVCGRSD